MVKCPYCKGKKRTNLFQYNINLIGLGNYGRFFKCKICNKCFFMLDSDATQSEIISFNKYGYKNA